MKSPNKNASAERERKRGEKDEITELRGFFIIIKTNKEIFNKKK